MEVSSRFMGNCEVREVWRAEPELEEARWSSDSSDYRGALIGIELRIPHPRIPHHPHFFPLSPSEF